MTSIYWRWVFKENVTLERRLSPASACVVSSYSEHLILPAITGDQIYPEFMIEFDINLSLLKKAKVPSSAL